MNNDPWLFSNSEMQKLNFLIFAHGRDTSRDKTRHSSRLCLCVPQTLCAVSRQVQGNSEVVG